VTAKNSTFTCNTLDWFSFNRRPIIFLLTLNVFRLSLVGSFWAFIRSRVDNKNACNEDPMTDAYQKNMSGQINDSVLKIQFTSYGNPKANSRLETVSKCDFTTYPSSECSKRRTTRWRHHVAQYWFIQREAGSPRNGPFTRIWGIVYFHILIWLSLDEGIFVQLTEQWIRLAQIYECWWKSSTHVTRRIRWPWTKVLKQ